ncbi:MAG: tRNA (adenosine(37)-N6)-threonylcarbamoyltransferase complex dimerization subunit type 1 TsaB [Christensenellaceae bacterium]
MNYIAVDTSGKHLTLIANKGGKIYEYFDPDCGVDHSVSLMPELERLLRRADMNINDADFFACAVGAGSFTGIRIGVSTVKALAFAADKPVLRLTSFDTLSYNIDNGKVLAVIDAKHNGYYICPYVDGTAGTPEYALKDRLADFKGYRLVSGEKIEGLDTTVVSVAEGLKRAIEKKAGEVSRDINSLTPLYVRKSQAEEGR